MDLPHYQELIIIRKKHFQVILLGSSSLFCFLPSSFFSFLLYFLFLIPCSRITCGSGGTAAVYKVSKCEDEGQREDGWRRGEWRVDESERVREGE